MAKRKLSAEEKRIKLLEIFHESGDVFQLKDLERQAPKEKGIVMQSVKPILQELVDSGAVRAEKISGSLYYWSFPSDSLKSIQRQLKESEAAVSQLNENIAAAQFKLQVAAAALKNSNEIDKIQTEISQLCKEKQELEHKLAAHANDLDYEALAAKHQDAKRILDAGNRWTNNIFSIKYWCKEKYGKDDRELNKAFGIPDDLDILEE